jgi:hypothetical protein
MDRKIIDKLKKEFSFLKDKTLGVIIFGSCLESAGRDIDICVISPKYDSKELLYEIFCNVDTYGKKYDVFIFEELPLYMKLSIIQNYKVIFSKNLPSLSEYFYFYRKFLEDFKQREKKIL